MRTRLVAATLLAAVTLTLTACGSDQAAAFDDADVTFASDMVPHHRQATDMAALAPGRTDNAAVLNLAADIDKAQGPEITVMSGWMSSWGKDVPVDDATMPGMGHGSTPMPGMMSDTDMAALRAAKGPDFDTRFLTMMIQHHEGAVAMAEQEQADGRFSKAVALARTIQDDQTGQIDLMKSLLSR